MNPLEPYQYSMVFALLREPLTASELASMYPMVNIFGGSSRSCAGALRPLVRRGWVERSYSGVYGATERARLAVSW